MKITTWNVNGYRAIVSKGFREWFIENNADILLLQEVKARPEQVNPDQKQFKGYKDIWNPAVKLGYSGVCVFSRIEPLEYGLGMGDTRFDHEGRLIWMRFPDVVIYNVYFPSGQRGMERVEYKLAFYYSLLELVKKHHQEGVGVIIGGDFNTAHTEIDLANPKQNSKTSGFLPEERAWIDLYLDNGMRDVFRDLYPDRRQYSWWTYRSGARQRNIGWRLDYFLASESLRQRVIDVVIHNEATGSDHCPVSLFLE
jgi:exodeoxyribonuclease III